MNRFRFGAILLFSVMIFVSAGALTADAQRRDRTRTWNGGRTVTRTTTLWSGQRSDRRWRRDRDSDRRARNTYGFRNYGQYRRTQVGNRRFRTVNRSTWVNGNRVVRRVRINY